MSHQSTTIAELERRLAAAKTEKERQQLRDQIRELAVRERDQARETR